MRRIALIAIFMVLAGVAQAAEPTQPEAQADELMRQGLELRRQGQNAQALEILQKVETLAPSAIALAQLGSVEFALQKWVEAEGHLEKALGMHDSPWIEMPRNRDMLEKTLASARRHIGRLDVRGATGIQISVDGRAVGVLPLPTPLHVAAGSVRVEATAVGRQSLEKAVAVAAGEDAVVAIELMPVPPPPPPVAPALSVQTQRTEAREVPTWRRWTGGSLFVVGLATVGTGIGWMVVNGRTNCSAPPGGFCEQVYNTKTQGWVAIAAGAVAVGAGATLFLWKGKDTSAGIAIGPESLTLHGQF